MAMRWLAAAGFKEIEVNRELADKFGNLRASIKKTGGLAIAFSGGLDSTFLAAVAVEELGDRALAVTALSPTYPQREQREAAELAAAIGIRHMEVHSNELEIEHFAENPPDRCYYCKSELFTVVRRIAGENEIKFVADGTNADDMSDHRPGRRASCEQGVMAPLLEAGLGKDEIRQLSRQMNLPTAEKPAFACLASRFPYGSEITAEKLAAIDKVENGVMEMGISQVRVRHHGTIARIEVQETDIARICEPEMRKKIVNLVKDAGFHYAALDLQGYRTGSMNEVLRER
jgi:uncharacterized protein